MMRGTNRLQSTLPIVGACFLALIAAVVTTGWLSLGICLLGFAPETLMLGDTFAPLSALFLGGWFVGRVCGARSGWKIGALAIAFWLVAWLLLLGRFSPSNWWHDGILSLSWTHLWSWTMALFAASAGGWLGARYAAKWIFGATTIVILAALWSAQWLSGASWRDVKSEALIFSREAGDGTQIRLLRYDLTKVKPGVYDADFDDARPFDDRNASWLGQAMPLVWRGIERANGGKTLCAVNGGFFGADFPYIARHEAPIVNDGIARYDSRVLENDWTAQNCALAWKTSAKGTQLSLIQDADFDQLTPHFDGVLGGVRALIENGRSLPLKPGMGGTTLKCSRTSVAWKDGEIYLLSVRDPDGEKASLRADKREKAGALNQQSGGWNVRQVQQFWAERHMENAVLFDGGESTQLALRTETGVLMTHSSYHFTRTPLVINGKPLRFVLPMLPAFEANGGVLNYFYLAAN